MEEEAREEETKPPELRKDPPSLIEEVAAEFALASRGAPASLKALSCRLKSLADALRGSDEPAFKVASAAQATVDKMLAGKSANPDTDLETVAEAVSCLQTALSGRGSEKAVPAPDQGTDSAVRWPPIQVRDPELAKDLVAEALEHLELADMSMVKLEKDPGDIEAIHELFRAVHTIKGSCGFAALSPITDLAHEAEALFDRMRQTPRSFTSQIADLVFRTLDMLRRQISDLSRCATTGQPFEARPELPRLLDALRAASRGDAAPTGAPLEAGKTSSPTEETTRDTVDPANARHSIRVDAEKLDLLLDTIGELVVAESVVAEDCAIQSLLTEQAARNMAHLAKITRTLQNVAMSLRMFPVEGVFRRMARVVRDAARRLGKKVDLVTEGGETELDRMMIEKITDPLVHLLRNAVDHGIEADIQDRIRAGKPAVGRIVLRASQRGGNIQIEVEDDGRGLDRKAIIDRAVRSGLVSEAKNLSEEDLHALIFKPGFSTAAFATETSGRGVGLDVVKRNLESLQGTVRVKSVPGAGTTFTLHLPMTLAIIDGMLVRVGTERYVVPTLAIVESLRPSREMLFTIAGKGQMLLFRGQPLPLFRLADLFGVPATIQDPSRAILVVVEDTEKRTAIMVDDLLGQQQTVIKTLSGPAQRTRGVSGATILADGRPGLILDIRGIVELATGRN